MRNQYPRIGIVALALLVALAAWAVVVERSTAQGSPCLRGTFANFNTESKPGDSPTFELSQDYPDSLAQKENYPWMAVAFENGGPADPRAYIEAMLEYGLEGNIDVDWVVQKNSIRPWYHIPWMDYGPSGREYVHGLTHELDAEPEQLGPDQTKPAQTWAVSIINDRGAFGIGQVWCDPADPKPNMLNPNQDEPNWFPDGAAQIKLLFTTAADDQVPWLSGTFEWEADLYVDDDSNSPSRKEKLNDPNASPLRTLRTARLLQVDVAVRDSRVIETGWAFGTFIYDGGLEGETPWARLTPVGLMWGNDPGITPEMVQAGFELRQSWINDSARNIPGNHLGWAGRLAGPLDNATSSCMSCHMVAGQPTRPILPEIQFSKPRPLPAEMRLNWFQNVSAGVPFAYDQVTSLDYSLQLDIGMDRFHIANKHIGQLSNEKFSPSRDQGERPPAEILSIDPDSGGAFPVFGLVAAGGGGLAAGAFIALTVMSMRKRQRSGPGA